MSNNKNKALVIVILLLSVFFSTDLQSETSIVINQNPLFQPENNTYLSKHYPIPKEDKLDESFGDQNTFWVFPNPWAVDQDAYQINATLLAEGEWCYVYLDNASIDRWGYNESLALCSEIRDNFDAITYPKGVELAGHPNGTLGDIDGDPKVTLLIIDDEAFIGGYYAFDDNPFGTSNPQQNNREMICVYTEENPNSICYSSILAHEFNHL
ncbi:MAG: hypothetical protein H7641_07090, partial [Candidatus Heimdallarchaeota archaeon]|nr:hypothetical protein [Candidatus Heimdallarchaeota archaeon]MCK4877329.1 hypothetical protein [Candidatus Heimdallarchaeota archaeon]